MKQRKQPKDVVTPIIEGIENDVVDDEYMQYFLDTYINGQFGQLRNMYKHIRKAGKAKDMRSFLDEMGGEECTKLKDWMIDNVDESVNHIVESSNDKNVIYVTYNELGYTVYKGSEELYHAGNSPDSSESTVPLSNALPLEKIKEYAEQTAKEMAEEHSCEFTGSEYEKIDNDDDDDDTVEESSKIIMFADFVCESDITTTADTTTTVTENKTDVDTDEDGEAKFKIMCKIGNKSEEECDTAKDEEEAKYLVGEYKLAFHTDNVWYDPIKK